MLSVPLQLQLQVCSKCTLTRPIHVAARLILLGLYQQFRSLRNKGHAALKLGLVRPARQIKFASDKGNQITTRKVEEEVPLFEQSDDWVLQFDLAYNEDGQRKNGPFPAHIATT